MAQKPVANFSATPTNGCAPLLVSFSDLSTNHPINWKWDLGNGTVSHLQNPSVSYVAAGQYKISLIVSNRSGIDTIIKQQYITVFSTPAVNFTGNYSTLCLPLTVQFNDLTTSSNGKLNSWRWDFGDGIISADQNPKHIYTLPGNHDVTLEVTNSYGCSGTFLHPGFINIPAPVIADFSNVTTQTSCNPPTIINFTNLSTGPAPLSYSWEFGDSLNSNVINPYHIYNNAGNYTIQLFATSSYGCSDSIKKTISISSVNSDFTPITACPNKKFTFRNTSLPKPLNVLWNFGDNTTSVQLNPSKTYITPGSYNVLMVANYGTCVDSVSKAVTVFPKPAFTADDTVSSKVPFTVNFKSNLPAEAGQLWEFGDGTTSSEINPSHTYTALGNFNVTLTSGCQDSIKLIQFIKIDTPLILLFNLPVQGCIPFTDTFSVFVNSVISIISYKWDFGDGTMSTLINPIHTFTVAGSYNITLTVTTSDGATFSQTVASGVTVGIKPSANFYVDSRISCASSQISFTDNSTGNVNQWLWFFGDGSTSGNQNPVHIYTHDTGYFNVSLIAKSNGCPDTVSFAKYIFIKPPIANFSYTNSCTNPTQIVFQDRSIGADTWNWNFGDSSHSILKNPTHSYPLVGTYTVNLLVSNISTGCSFLKTNKVLLVSQKAAFETVDTLICKGTSAVFEIQNSINPSQIAYYYWDFGDNTSVRIAADSAPKNLQFSHAYLSGGVFSIRLIITNILGCNDTLLKPMYIKVDSLSAGFTSNIPGGCLNNAIYFTDKSITDSTHPIIQWRWNYGDNIIDSLATPLSQHLYTKPGVYNVKLNVTDSYGCTDSSIRKNYVEIVNPIAQFTTSSTASCPLQNITFTGPVLSSGYTYLWSFGDSTTSVSSKPIHSYYSTGIFSVGLKITSQYGCSDSIEKLNYISITYPVADFVMSDSVSSCPPFFIQFNNHSANYNSLSWDFGDGNTSSLEAPIHSYNIPGTYFVKLTVTGPGGCTDEMTRKVLLKGPNGTLSYTGHIGCGSLLTNFDATTSNNTSFIWDFSDGNTVSTTDSIISHEYIDTGYYIPKMILIDSNNCHVAITGIDTLKVISVNAGIITNWRVMCDSGNVLFSDSSKSNEPITKYYWDFKDGTGSIINNPVHQYLLPGLYYPQLIVTTLNGCSDTTTSQVPIKIVASPKAAIASSGNGCTPLNAIFNGQLLVADTSAIAWNWDFSNGTTATLQNPNQQTYLTAGVYNVLLKIVNSSGCFDTVSKTIEAYIVPTVYAGNDTTICEKRGFTLKPSGADTYTWSPSNGLSCVDCTNPVATPATETQYYLVGTTIHGCSAKDSINIKVKYPFTMNYSETDSLCKGSSKKIYANGANSYEWTPAEGLNSTTTATPTATPDTTTTYQVIGTDDLGCFRDTGFVYIKIYPIPTVDAGPDKTINVGQTITLVPVISNDVTSVEWSPSGSLARNAYSAITVSPMQTIEFTVDVKNAGGCTASDRVTVYVVCNGANVFIPNTFSPNGDGANDIFYPRGTGLFSVKSFRIFNRWGEVVFEKQNFMPNNSSDGWDGSFKGVKLTSDVFMYTIDIVCENNSVLTFNGNIALIQ